MYQLKCMDQNSCKNCGTPLAGSICYECGQKVIKERWSVSDFCIQFIAQITNIEKGFTYTIISMFKNPGKVLTDYWTGCTIPYYNPLRFALILIAINLLVSFTLGINEMLAASMSDMNAVENIDPGHYEEASDTFNQWLNVLVLLLIPIRGLITWVLFRKKGHNYAEHLIMNSFIMGQQAFFSSITQFLFYFIPGIFVIYMPFNFLIGVMYDSWVFKSTFRDHIIIIILKAILVGIIGILVFLFLIKMMEQAVLMITG